jgi:hypothetical protein
MIGNWLDGILPKAAGAGIVAWAFVNYVAIGVEIGARVIRADHLPACGAGFSETIKRQAEQAIAAIPRPRIDEARESAARQVREMMKTPYSGLLENHPLFGGVNAQVKGALAGYEQEKAELQAAYRRMVEQINAATAVKLGKADDYCACVGERVIELARTELAVWTGSLGLVRPAKIKDFSVAMAQAGATGVCSSLAN